MAAISGPDVSDSGVDFLHGISPQHFQICQEGKHLLFAVKTGPIESNRDVIWRWLSRDLPGLFYPFGAGECWLRLTHMSSIPAYSGIRARRNGSADVADPVTEHP